MNPSIHTANLLPFAVDDDEEFPLCVSSDTDVSGYSYDLASVEPGSSSSNIACCRPTNNSDESDAESETTMGKYS